MHNKTQMSVKTKKILTGVGVVFGTVMVFLVSFIMAFSLIVNPISIFSADDSETAKENEKLKAEMQTMNDTIERLNTTVDKYKAQANRPAVYEPATVTTPSTGTAPKSDKTDAPSTQPPAGEQNGTQTTAPGEGTADGDAEEFSPDTVDSSSEQTPEDVETPIPVIDVSE